MSVELLEAGIATYIEKPLAISIEDADRILEAGHRTGTKVYVGHGGDYYFKDWHAERDKAMSLLLQKGAHDIDVMHWIAGSATARVVGMGGLMVYGSRPRREPGTSAGMTMKDWLSHDHWPADEVTGLNPVIDVEDLSMVMMRMRNGVMASYQQCHFTPDYWRSYTVIGTRGRAENLGDGDGGVVRVWTRRTGYAERGSAEYPIIEEGAGHEGAERDGSPLASPGMRHYEGMGERTIERSSSFYMG